MDKRLLIGFLLAVAAALHVGEISVGMANDLSASLLPAAIAVGVGYLTRGCEGLVLLTAALGALAAYGIATALLLPGQQLYWGEQFLRIIATSFLPFAIAWGVFPAKNPG